MKKKKKTLGAKRLSKILTNHKSTRRLDILINDTPSSDGIANPVSLSFRLVCPQRFEFRSNDTKECDSRVRRL